ncbi:aryl-alcohol dehydrogenase [Pseudoxanthomonas sp. GM95]|uniref:NAD(P)-dependent alcohol dehydrogenase n=1 Tax=Pseudoxanthomonas sp. GM95 TaxID=1881043 RepID=UPI0008B47862|nr:NAD(P)-dependent alcohol dehydrogenase [Pseudoxanthomonas sp. GM95]SEM54069.1 aryl-alcohol dehydrogenase [Pseudoxanthomonas sp. GM95]
MSQQISSERKPIRAAVLRVAKTPLVFEDASLEAPRANEVLVRMVATGVCHTDMVVRDQLYQTALPMILGHEGAGVVEKIGSDVTTIEVGDHVVITYAYCGLCGPCATGHPAHCQHMGELNFAGGRLDGTSAACDAHGGELHDHFFGQSSFSTHSVVSELNVVKVRKDVPLELLGPLGCGIQTGSGAVLNALKVHAGSSFVAFGTGAVGLAAVMAARVAGATTIIAVDINAERLAMALELGATHVINSRETDPVARIRELTNGGADFTLECSGRPEVLRQCIDSLGILGSCGIVGATREGTEASFNVNDVMIPGRRIIGIVQGDVVSRTFIPELVELYRQGRFPFDRLVKFYDFEQLNQAMADSESGITIKPILRFPAAA